MSSNTLTLNYGNAYAKEYNLVKRQNKRLKLEKAACIKIANIAFFAVAVLLALAVTIGISAVVKINALQNQVDTLYSENQRLIQENEQIKTEAKIVADSLNDISEEFKSVSEVSTDLDNENQLLLEACQSKDDIISEYEERSELFDKYEFAILDKNGDRTDIKYSDIKMLNELCEEKGLNNNTVDLVLAIVMTESSGDQYAKNTSSTATGFGQFLSGTGSFVYKKLMGNDSYNHSQIATSGTDNLEMMIYYLEYLNNECNGNIGEVINKYRGINDRSYKYKINEYLSTVGLSLAEIQIS